MDFKCDHVCHERGLNPWVKSCPMCGCANPKYDPAAAPDIAMPPAACGLDEALGLIDIVGAKLRAKAERRGKTRGGRE